MEEEPEPKNQDVQLMPSTQQVTIKSPTPPTTGSSLVKEEEVVPLDDDLVMKIDPLMRKVL